VAVAQSVYFACGLRAKEFVYSREFTAAGLEGRGERAFSLHYKFNFIKYIIIYSFPDQINLQSICDEMKRILFIGILYNYVKLS
jgi:hypothetical protein